MTKTKNDAALLHFGQHVERKDGAEAGTVIEANRNVKIKWDSGHTSYFRRDKPANVKLKDSNE